MSECPVCEGRGYVRSIPSRSIVLVSDDAGALPTTLQTPCPHCPPPSKACPECGEDGVIAAFKYEFPEMGRIYDNGLYCKACDITFTKPWLKEEARRALLRRRTEDD